MNAGTDIRLEAAKRLTPREELALVGAAWARRPGTPDLRARLASLYARNDRYDEAVALLDPCDDLSYHEAVTLMLALLAQEQDVATRRAVAVAEQALAPEPPEALPDNAQAELLAHLGKALVRLGDRRARDVLERSLALNPHGMDACKRLAALHFRAGDPQAVLAMARDLSARGAGHARLFAAEALACAQLGEFAAAQAMVGLDTFHAAAILPPPPGWASIDAFNVALADELLDHPALTYERYGSASERTWRIDALATRQTPLTDQLLAGIRAAAADHLAQLGSLAGHEDHPWLRARPPALLLHAWCVITDSPGHEIWHVHQFGWMSGAYYVAIPPALAAREDQGGCIAFGLPEDLAGDSGAGGFGNRVVRPRSGLLTLFPSHAYHRTYPHGEASRRICVAFDLRPA